MRKPTNLMLAALASLVLFSCQKDKSLAEEAPIADEVLAKINALGFSTSKVEKHDDGFLVEGDIVLTPQMLASAPDEKLLRIAEEEQYHTFNLVKNGPRTINVKTEGNFPPAFITALDAAIGRYNAENLSIDFTRNTSAPANITIKLVTTTQYIASAGFPTSAGEPYGTINYSSNYLNYSEGFLATVLAHEMGHCIGFRHTDYMRRAYSCGSGGNEGQVKNGVGAVLIPGTPSGPDAASWMLACLSATTDRPFNANDKIALSYLYK